MSGADRMTRKSGREPGHITLLCDAGRVDEYQRYSVGLGLAFEPSWYWEFHILDLRSSSRQCNRTGPIYLEGQALRHNVKIAVHVNES